MVHILHIVHTPSLLSFETIEITTFFACKRYLLSPLIGCMSLLFYMASLVIYKLSSFTDMQIKPGNRASLTYDGIPADIVHSDQIIQNQTNSLA